MSSPRSVAALLIRLAFAVTVLSPGTPTRAAVSAQPLSSRLILFAPSGMRPDLLERYVAAGAMPTFQQLIERGVLGVNGLAPAFPANDSVASFTIATGTWAGEHGIVNDTFHRIGEINVNERTLAGEAGLLQTDTLAAAAERSGKKVAQLEWAYGAAAAIRGPTVDGVTYFSARGVLVHPLDASEQAGAAAFGVAYEVASIADAAGWTNVPMSHSPAKETLLAVPTTFAAQNPSRTYNVYVYDGTDDATVNYDSLLLVRFADAKDGSQAAVTLSIASQGFREIKLLGADGLIGARAGQTAGFYVNLLSLAPDLSALKLYFTSVQRARATCATAACDLLPGGGVAEDRLEKYVADHLPTPIAADYATFESGVVAEETYVEQGLYLAQAHLDAVLDFVLGTLQPDTQLALVGYPPTADLSREFLGLVTAMDLDGNPNPRYDDRDGDGLPDGLVSAREYAIRGAYVGADERLGRAKQLMGGSPTVIATSDHGIAPVWYAINAPKVLADAGLQLPEQPGNCRAGSSTRLAKACWSGGAAHIYLNVTGRDAGSNGLPASQYDDVRDAIITAFQSIRDPAHPDSRVVDRILKKEELRDVDGADALHPSRSGDLVVVAAPPYQFTAPTPGQVIAPIGFFGEAGFLPDLVDVSRNANMHGVFVASGPGIRQQAPIAGIRSIDIAPTVAFLMGFPGAQSARGRIAYPLLPAPGRFKELTILGISDFTGQLTPLAEPADDAGTDPSFTIGGAAYLKPWLDAYRAEAPNGSITVAGGGSTGGTPPISHFFGDVPAIQAMNLMGFSVDALGYPNFERGQSYLRTSLIPLASFPFVAANVVYTSNGRTPAEWSASRVFDVFGGTKLGVVGFADDDLASLVPGDALQPFKVVAAEDAVKAELSRLKAKKVNAVVALGYAGATGGTLDAPTGPVVSLADGVPDLDAVIGDRTDFQVVATRPNGVLIVENRSKGTRFTRLRLVFDTSRKAVTYRTADHHKPWNLGVTPDPAIAAQVDGLTAQLTPLFATVVGNSNVQIPRSDACGNGAGRTCESLVGNVVADAMRRTYSADFAIANSGGFRAELTCPTTDAPGDLCPAYTPPPYPITRGQVLAVLAFGNVAVTLQVNGAELKSVLENGVSVMPSANGKFPQVSGLCFTYDISAPPGSRVTSAVRQATNGSCTGAPIDLTSASTYSIVENDFMVAGGDGYPNLVGRSSTRDPLDQLTADFISASSPITPAIQGRIVCTTSGSTACPVVAQ